MASINTRVVRRSNALQGWAYGRGLRYREAMGIGGRRWSGGSRRPALAAGVGALLAGLAFPPDPAVLDRVLPVPGRGTGREGARAPGFFKIDIHARTSERPRATSATSRRRATRATRRRR